MQPKFVYFDLGKVLLDFDVELMCRRMGEVAGISRERIIEAVFDSGLQLDYEAGRVTSRGFFERFCELTGTRPDYDALSAAGADIFTINLSIVPVVAQLQAAGYRTGVLSNTCEGHWEHCFRRFRLLREGFSIYVLSYKIGCCKPDSAIFHAAAEMAGCRPEEIFYTDDIAGHIEGARSIGFDAVQYTGTPALTKELRKRGVRFNY